MIRRVLIADDDEPIRHMVKTILTREGYQVDEAENGAEALEKIKEDDYGAIVLDLMMPVVNGYEVLDYLTRAQPQRKCVVIISAAASGEIAKADPTIVKGVLRKPFELTELTRAVNACFES
jgi:CheY-like chemotaxis protein